MEQIVVQIHDKYKAKILVELLTALDFVNVVKTSESLEEEEHTFSAAGSNDFFSYAGLWANRAITLGTLRQQAWRQYEI